MLSSQVAQSLKSYGHFSDLGGEIGLSQRHVDLSSEANTSIHGLEEHDTDIHGIVGISLVGNICRTTAGIYTSIVLAHVLLGNPYKYMMPNLPSL